MIDPDEERARFISLHEVLFLIAQARRCDAQRAAEWLALNINKGDALEHLHYKRYRKTYGICDLDSYSENEEFLSLIRRLAEDGITRPPMPRNYYLANPDDDIPF